MNSTAIASMSRQIDPRLGTFIFLLFSFLYLFGTLFLLPATPIFFENDHFIQMYDSVRMLNGEVLYKDFFQFTFPGTEIWYLLLFKIFGQRIWLLNATIILLGLSITWVILAISRRLMTGVYVYIAPSIFLFFGFRWYGMDGGHRLFSCLFAMLAIFFLIDRITLARLVAAGAFASLATFFTQNRGLAIFAAIAIFLALEFCLFRTGDRKRASPLSLVTFAASFAIYLALFIAYFIYTAGASTFVGSTLLFAKNYNADPLNNSNFYFLFWQSLISGTFNRASLPVDLFYYLLVPAIYVLPLLYFVVKRPANGELWRKVMLLCISGIFLFLATTGLSSVRLYHVSLPGIILFALWVYNSRWRSFGFASTCVVVALSFGLCIWGQFRSYPPIAELPTGSVVFPSDVAGERYRWLNENTVPGDLVFEPYRSVVNFPLSVQNPTSFSFLRNSNYTPPEHVAKVIEQLNSKPPKFILWDGSWSLEPSQREPGDNLAPLYDHLRRHYHLRQPFTQIFQFKPEVWERNAG